MASTDWASNEWEHGSGFTEGLDDEIKGMDELKLSHRLTKTKEEIERFTVDEMMDEQQKAIHLLKNGAEIQKQSVVAWLSSQRYFNKEQKQKILVVLIELLSRSDNPPSFLLNCGRTLKELLQEGVLDAKLTNTLLPVIRRMLESKDQEILDQWSDVMLNAIQFMSLDTLESEILPEAILNSGLSQPVPYRLWSCKVFGALAKRMEARRIEGTFLKKAMALCQDTDYEVRSCMAKQLNVIAKGVGLELTKSTVLNEFTELLNDEELVVRQSALSSLVHLLDVTLPVETDINSLAPAPISLSTTTTATTPNANQKKEETPTILEKVQQAAPSTSTPKASSVPQRKVSIGQTTLTKPVIAAITAASNDRERIIVDPETKVIFILPMWRKLCADKSPSMLPTILQDFGLFIWGMKDVMRDEDNEWFLFWFQKLATGKDSSIKELCAYNIPALAKYLATITPEPSSTGRTKENATSCLAASPHFHSIIVALEALAADPNHAVRRRIASGLHELAQMLGQDAYSHLRQTWQKLLMDEEPDVFLNIFKSLHFMIKTFASDPRCHRNDPDFNQLLVHILKKYQTGITTPKWQWRYTYELFKQFKHLPKSFDPEPIVNTVVPLLFSILLDPNSISATSTVRDVCIETIAWYARYVPKLDHRQRIWQSIIDNLTVVSKTTYKQRIYFLEIMKHILDLFSSTFFKETFFAEYLQTGRDPVPNVRLKMVELLPAVRRTLKLPADSQHMQKLNDIVARLVMEEEDRGVSKLLNSIVDSLTNTKENIVKDPVQSSASTSNSSKTSNTPSFNAPLSKLPGATSIKVSATIGGGSSTNSAIPAVMQQQQSNQTQATQNARLAFEARDKEKEEEEERLLKEEAEYEDQRKKRDIEEARYDFTKRLAERSINPGDKLPNIKDKFTLHRTTSKESTSNSNLKAKIATPNRKNSVKDVSTNSPPAIVLPHPKTAGAVGILKSGASVKSGQKWGSDQNVSPSMAKRASTTSVSVPSTLQTTQTSGSVSPKSSMERLSTASMALNTNSAAVLKTTSKTASGLHGSAHFIANGGINWSSSNASPTSRVLPNVSANMNIGGTAGYGPNSIGKDHSGQSSPAVSHKKQATQ